MCVRLLSEFFSFPTQSNHMQVRVTEGRRCGSTFVELGDKLKLTETSCGGGSETMPARCVGYVR